MTTDMPAYAYFIAGAGWILYMTPFLLRYARRNKARAVKRDRRARWGMPFIAVAYSLLWQGSFWMRSPAPWRIAVAVLFFLAACVLAWSSLTVLGRQWRFDAAVNADHRLVQSGPYRLIRHPIYTSLFCVLLGTGALLVTPLSLLLPAFLALTIGTEIRVRIEDKLLAAQFGGEFLEYQRRVPAYIPFLK
jgi:protein-S-isoprenylcysteine O-methyltransferase Ste14